MSDPLKAAQDDAAATAAETEAAAEPETEKKEPEYGYLEFDGEKFGIHRRPNTLLISELARTDPEDPESLGVFAEFFDVTLASDYRKFKRHMYRSTAGEDPAALQPLLQQVMEATLGRPTD